MTIPITIQEIGAFFRALGEQMIKEDDVCAGAILGTQSSREAIVKNMTNRFGYHEFEVDKVLAYEIVKAAQNGGACLIAEWFNAFGEITLP